MIVKPLDKAAYAGKKFTVRYRTGGYYDIRPSERGFRIDYVPFDAPVEKSFDDEFFGEWLEDPSAFGVFEGDRLAAFVEGSPERWNNRYRISNICIFDDSARRSGVGTRLMEAVTKAAEASGARMIVTPRDIDAQIRFLSAVLAGAINRTLHPNLTAEDFAQFVPFSCV